MNGAKQVDARVLFLLLAARKVGSSLYSWGGESADEGGFDCSGFVSVCLTELARHYPEIYDGQRRTANGIFQYFAERGAIEIEPGDRGRSTIHAEELIPGMVVFYPRTGKKTHVAIHATTAPPLVVSGLVASIPVTVLDVKKDVGPIAFEAGGSGSAATSPRAALLRAATVRMTATDRSVFLALDPFVLIGAE